MLNPATGKRILQIINGQFGRIELHTMTGMNAIEQYSLVLAKCSFLGLKNSTPTPLRHCETVGLNVSHRFSEVCRKKPTYSHTVAVYRYETTL